MAVTTFGRNGKHNLPPGLKIHKFTVIRESEPKRDKRGHVKTRRYLLKCECGNKKIVDAGNLLRSNPTKSCGCYKVQRYKAGWAKKPTKEQQEKRELLDWLKFARDKLKSIKFNYQNFKYKTDPDFRKQKLEKCRRWHRDNRAKAILKKSRRKRILQLATPKWLTDIDHKKISDLYKEAKRLSEETGVTYNVDHIIPLQGKIICGLHVPSNLRIISFEENMSKGNKFVA